MPLPYALDLGLVDWQKWAALKNQPSFLGKQIYEWIFQKGQISPKDFSNISQTLREELSSAFEWKLPDIDSRLPSSDGSEKFLLKSFDGQLFEMVLMPYEERCTLCISSQVGCKMGCTFCQTGKMGFKRNLSSGEILSQIILANRFLKGAKVTNIVYMGMGEPLDNYDAVVKASSILIDPLAFGLSKARVTISTSGLIPEIHRLGQDLPVRLAISLHSTDEEKRSRMMPINRRYSLAALKEALLAYPAPKRHGITFEYVLIEGQNDSIADAKSLVKYLHGLKAKVNLIPVNNFPGMAMRPPQEEKIREFQKYLSDRSIPAPVRYSRGQDISGGCGQLAAKRKAELDLDPRALRRLRKEPYIN